MLVLVNSNISKKFVNLFTYWFLQYCIRIYFPRQNILLYSNKGKMMDLKRYAYKKRNNPFIRQKIFVHQNNGTGSLKTK